MSTTDPKQAAVLRQIADLYSSIGREADAKSERANADTLDPPKPRDVQVGTIAWVTAYKSNLLMRKVEGGWATSRLGDGTSRRDYLDSEVSNVEVVLSVNQVVLPDVFAFWHPSHMRQHAEDLSRQHYYVEADLMRMLADALEKKRARKENQR